MNCVTNWLDSYSGRTKGNYIQRIRWFEEESGTTALQLLAMKKGEAHALLLQYRQLVIGMKLSANSINARLSSVRSLLNYANQVGYIDWNVRIKNVPVETYKDTSGPPREVIARMIQLCDPETYDGARDRCVIRCLHDMALRRAEVERLDYGDLSLSFRVMRVKGKGRIDYDMLPFGPALENDLKWWLKARGTNPGPLFLTKNRKRLTGGEIHRVVALRSALTGTLTHPHALRHAGITSAIKNGHDLASVRTFSRHKDLKTLQHYVDNVAGAQKEITEGIEI